MLPAYNDGHLTFKVHCKVPFNDANSLTWPFNRESFICMIYIFACSIFLHQLPCQLLAGFIHGVNKCIRAYACYL